MKRPNNDKKKVGKPPEIPEVFQGNRNVANIEGFFETVSVVPTHEPKTFSESVKIYENSGVKRLYIYYASSKATKGWMYIQHPFTADTGWTTFTNLTPDKTCDANATNVAELADILGTLIEELKVQEILAD